MTFFLRPPEIKFVCCTSEICRRAGRTEYIAREVQEVEPVLLLRFRKSLFNLGHSLFTQTSLGVGKLLGSLFKILQNRGRTYGADCNTFIDGDGPKLAPN